MMYTWIIPVAIVILVVWYFNKDNTNTSFWKSKDEAPLDILKRRFSSGKIDEEEYEKRKALLEEDEY